MLLALDIGNSNISLGVFRGAELRMRAKISVQTRRSADEYAAILYDLLRMRQISREEIGGCIHQKRIFARNSVSLCSPQYSTVRSP